MKSKPIHRTPRLLSLALGLALVSLTAGAQNTGTGRPTGADPAAASGTTSSAWSTRSDSWSLLPYTRRGYVGLNLGQSDFDLSCGLGNYECDKSKLSGYLYTGGLVNDWLGAELGYLNTGKSDRAGGHTRAQGINLSAVFRMPVGPVNLFAKGGAIYGETRVSAGLLSNVPTGKRRGWGASYGGGVGYDFTPNSGVVAEWMRTGFKFPGSGREDVDTTMLGYVHRF